MSTLDNLEALSALAKYGTMTRAARQLRVSQSAVSKRIAALEDEAGVPLIEADGRRVRLTGDAQRLLDQTSPLVAELKSALRLEASEATGRIELGVSESVLCSWGAGALAQAAQSLGNLQLAISTHRSPVIIDRVRSGEYLLGLVAGSGSAVPGLAWEALVEESLIIVPSGLVKPRRRRQLDILTIDPGTATWPAIAPEIDRLRRQKIMHLRVTQTVQSFASAVQMARAGLGHALVPVGIARALGVTRKDWIATPLSRPLILIGRPQALARPVCRSFAARIREQSRVAVA